MLTSCSNLEAEVSWLPPTSNLEVNYPHLQLHSREFEGLSHQPTG